MTAGTQALGGRGQAPSHRMEAQGRVGSAPGGLLEPSSVYPVPPTPVNTEPRQGQVAGRPVALNAISKGVSRCDDVSALAVLGKRQNS